MGREKLILTDLPEDILVKILTEFNPEFLFRLNSINKRFYGISHNDSLWCLKGLQHFPRRRFLNTKLFKAIYQDSYENIPINKRVLFSQVIENDCKAFRKQFSLNDLKLKNTHYETLLELAIFYKHQSILDFIFRIVKKAFRAQHVVEHPANIVEYQGEETLLHWACLCNQSPQTVEVLLKKGCNINQQIFWYKSPLSIAARFNYIELVNILLKNKADCSNTKALKIAAKHGAFDSVKILYGYLNENYREKLTQKKLNSILYRAAEYGHTEIVKFFLEKGAEVNSSVLCGITPLLIASSNGHVNTVMYLLNHGADIYMCTNDNNTSALFFAVQNYRREVVNLLLLYGADINQCQFPTTKKVAPITKAAELGSLEIMKALIAYNANVNHTCGSGMTPLHCAVEYNQIEVAQLLIKHGADLDAKYNNNTPLDLAKAAKQHDMIAMLLVYYRCARFYEKNGSNHANLSLLNSRKSVKRDDTENVSLYLHDC